MMDTHSVDFVLQLPADLAESAEEVRRNDPEYLSRVIRYGLVRRAIYEELDRSTRSWAPGDTPLPRGA